MLRNPLLQRGPPCGLAISIRSHCLEKLTFFILREHEYISMQFLLFLHIDVAQIVEILPDALATQGAGAAAAMALTSFSGILRSQHEEP